ncbi:MAG TPA: 2-dehydropantoate 2-reductase N-terminal domain-containing protein, partial [Chloroflexota bacterium]|nr:2-dehydropantoate 2-reductase N-terminal domain-containing protein [Chloroflexota bacterium]
MRFAVLGAGSLGLVVAGYLANDGHRVTVVAKPEQADRLRQREVEILAPKPVKVQLDVASRPEELEAADYLIVLVKARDTMAALDRVAGVEFGSVLSLQNGM